MCGVERFAVIYLQMSGQSEHKQAVYRGDGKLLRLISLIVEAFDSAKAFNGGRRGAHIFSHIYAEPQVAEQKQGLLRANQVCVFQQGGCTGYFVVEKVGVFREQLLAGLGFVFDNFGDDCVLKLLDDLSFRNAERGLVGELVEIASGLGAFAEQSPHGEIHIFRGGEEFFYLGGDFQGGQVQHNRDPDSCAEIGGAGGEVAISGAEGVIQFFFYDIVDVAYLLSALTYLHTAFEDLEAEVVFFVNHSGKEFLLCDDGASRAFAEGKMAADEVSFDEEVFIEGGGLVNTYVEDPVAEVE